MPWELRYRLGRKLASDWRRVTIEATHRHCRVEFRGPVHLGPGFELDMLEYGTFIVGPNVEFRRGFVCQIGGAGRVEIGAGSVFTYNTIIQCTTEMIIGERCVFAQDCVLTDGFHRYRDWTRNTLDQGFDLHPVHIDDGAFVASKCTVHADLGRHCMIGAHSLVNRPIPAYCFAFGTPAKVHDYFGPPDLRPAILDD